MAYTSLIRKEVHDAGNDGEQASNGQGGAAVAIKMIVYMGFSYGRILL